MFIDDDPLDAAETVTPTDEIGAGALLAACVAEAERQAAALHQLDAALGAALVMARRPPGNAVDGAALISALAADLQQADRLRQESEGLARALALLARLPPPSGTVRADEVRRCTPFVALQQRLLSPPGRG